VIFSESSSEDSSSDSELINKPECEETDVIQNSACYRKIKESTSDSETSSSEESENEEDEQEVEEALVNTTNTNTAHKKTELPRVKGELTLDDLPPVPDLSSLKIDVKEEDCIQMGTITSIVDKLVMVQSLPETPAYDVDTLLFLEKGKRPLGHVYDVIGPVSSPMYAIRFNSRQEIDTRGITKELAVYSAPKTEHTQYVFLKELLRIKGSDASWQGDNEVPPEFVDFSDDEEEFSVTNCTNDEYEMYMNKRKRNSLERHQIFEMEMNQRNKLDSAYHKLKDSCEPKYKKNTNSNTHANRTFNPFAGNTTYTQPTTNFVRPSQPPAAFGILPQPQWSFVPTIPPPSPGFGMQPLFQNHFCQPFPTFASQVLAFPPMNVPPPCSVPPPVPPTLPPMNIPPPIAQSVASAPPTVMPINPLPPGTMPFPHQGIIKNGHNLQQTDRTSNTHRRHGNGSRNHSNSLGKTQSSASMSQQQQTNVPLPKSQTYGRQSTKAAPPVPCRPPMQSLPPSLRNGPLPMVTNYGMQPVYRPFANCMQTPAPIPPGNMNFRPNGNGTSIPKTQGTGQVCPMPYPPCLGLPKFTTPPPNVSSNGNRAIPPSGPHFSGGVATFGHVPPPPCTQNGRSRQNLGSQNGCGFYRKQF
ncbi:H/ACA ribonucleoprotein complex non-core subunit NAF1-like, partial [Agrilus planipennis]